VVFCVASRLILASGNTPLVAVCDSVQDFSGTRAKVIRAQPARLSDWPRSASGRHDIAAGIGDSASRIQLAFVVTGW
jgi:hypothetical protein